MKKTTEKVSYSNYCLCICGVMKDDGFHRTKTKPNFCVTSAKRDA